MPYITIVKMRLCRNYEGYIEQIYIICPTDRKDAEYACML